MTRTVQFSGAGDIDGYFVKTAGRDFISWFNACAAGRKYWLRAASTVPLSIATDRTARDHFNELWSPESIAIIAETGRLTLLQFIALQSIIINETGGTLVPRTEIVGSPGHPGISYAFDSIPGLKKSYNTLPANKNCFLLFNDPDYNKEFGSLPLADQLMNTTDRVWQGSVYPQQTISTSTLPAVTGYVLEADFFKFRGRGFIQTTGRANYIKLIQFIAAYTGSNAVLTGIKNRWKSLSGNADTLASISTNADWDNLFQESSCLVAGKAIAIHNAASGCYLQELGNVTCDTIARMLYNMGLRISGADNYAMLFQNRVLQVLDLLQQYPFRTV